MATMKRHSRVKPRSKVVAKKKPTKLVVEVVQGDKADLVALRPHSMISPSGDVKYRVVAPEEGRWLVSVGPSQSSEQRNRGVAGRTPNAADQPTDRIQKVTETLGIAMRAAHADLESVDITRLVQTMMRVVPNKTDALADRVGPFYDTRGLQTWLDKSRQAIDKQVQAGKLLACMTSDRHRLYPVWQFTESGSLIPGLRDVLSALHSGTRDGWTHAVWLLTPIDKFNGSALDWLKAGGDPLPVVGMAREDAAVWAA